MRPILAALLSLALITPAWAGSKGPKVESINNPATLKECGACHMAFQPDFLPARSWEKLMTDLPNHFGTDASLSPDIEKNILTYLKSRSSDVTTSREGQKFQASIIATTTPLRISDVPRWVKEHRKISQDQWNKAKSKANCLSCHPKAEAGFYED